MSIAAIINSDNIFVGYTDDAANYVAESNMSLVEIDQAALAQLLIDASTKRMQYVNTSWVESNILEDVRRSKNGEQKLTYRNRKHFSFLDSPTTYQVYMDEESLRKLWADISMQEYDEVEYPSQNTTPIDIRNYAQRIEPAMTATWTNAVQAKEICGRYGRYLRALQVASANHIATIAQSSASELSEYDHTLGYPSVVTISN